MLLRASSASHTRDGSVVVVNHCSVSRLRMRCGSNWKCWFRIAQPREQVQLAPNIRLSLRNRCREICQSKVAWEHTADKARVQMSSCCRDRGPGGGAAAVQGRSGVETRRRRRRPKMSPQAPPGSRSRPLSSSGHAAAAWCTSGPLLHCTAPTIRDGRAVIANTIGLRSLEALCLRPIHVVLS